MHDDPRRKIPPAILKPIAILTAMLQAVSNGAKFLFLIGALDHEATAITTDQLRSLQVSVDEEPPGDWVALVRSIVEQLVPLSNRVMKELLAIQDHPVADFYLRQVREAAKLMEGEKMVKWKLEP